MNRRSILLLCVLALVAAVAPAGADHLEENSPPDPRHRVDAWTPKAPGSTSTIVLQYGPYVIHPGSDLSRVDVEVAALDGFVIAARPAVRLADGTEPSDKDIHIHHAHWIKIRDEMEEYQWFQDNPYGFSNAGNYYDWFFGTGEEKTRGGGEDYMKTDPRFESEGLRYGVPVARGDKMAFISMLHNKTPRAMVVWLEGRFEFVHGTREEIRTATGHDYHPLTPVLHGDTFQVPKVGRKYAYPFELEEGSGDLVPGVGHVWTSPFDGTIVIAAGHLHPGGNEVVVSNLGRDGSPCPNDDGDVYPGRTIQRIQAYYRDGVFPTEEFQMGITKLGWRAKIRKGDRIAINGVYDASTYAFPDAMSFFGFYVDQEDPPAADEACAVGLLDQPDAAPADVVMSMPNRPWDDEDPDHCTVCDDLSAPVPTKGQWTNTVQIAGFQYLPGTHGTLEILGKPWVRKGERLTFVNEDWALGLVRHTVTTCAAPCNGGYHANYPFHDGVFDSGAIGYTPVDTYEMKTDEPAWTLNTATLDPGYYTYYCRLHPWMAGGLFVDPPA